VDITSPYVVVAAIIITFAVSILFSTSSRPDDAHDDDHGHAH
jgi:hypothetical protein